MNRVPLILMLLFPTILAAQGQQYTIIGYVSNGVAGEPTIYVELEDTLGTMLSKTYTDRDGRYLFSDISAGTYEVQVKDDFFRDISLKVTVTSDLSLDTVKGEREMKTTVIWCMQSTDTQPTADPYFRQYRDFRRAIDALPLVFIDRNDGYNVDSVPDANNVMATLRGVSLEEGWLLDVHYYGNYGGGSVYFYTRYKDECKLLRNVEPLQPAYTLPPHILVDFTPEGIWSAYQLANACCYLPKYWHDYYGEYCGVFSLNEIRQRSPSLRDSLATTPEIHNRVELLDADNAIVTAYWWNDWEGLFEETVFVERVGGTVRFIFPNRENPDPRASSRTLVPYDCGIMF